MRIKVISFILAFCTVLLPQGVFADTPNNDDSGLSGAVAAAKAKLEIPDYYNDFYSQIEQDNNSKLFYLSWSGEGNNKEKGGNVSAKVDEHGRITYYSHYEYGSFEGDYKLSKLDYNGAVALASEYIKKICPEFAPSMRPESKNNYIERNYNNYYIKFIRYENGIPYYNNYIAAAISARSKKLAELEVKWDDILKFPSNQGTFPFDRAKENFKEKIGVSLGYYNDKDGNVILQYYPNMIGKGYINAFTGDISLTNISGGKFAVQNNVRDDFQYIYNMYANEQPEGLLSVEQLEQSARSQLLIDNIYALGKTDIYKSSSGEYCYSMMFVSSKKLVLNVQINAKTKEIINYYKDEDYTVGDSVNLEKALKTAKAFAQRISPERFKACSDNVKSYKGYSDYNNYLIDNNYYFVFPRLVNGIEYVNSGMLLKVSASSGEVISYSLSWEQKIFPSAADAVSTDTVYNELFERGGMELQYIATEKSSLISPKNAKDIDIKLVYNFNPDKPLYVNALSGKLSYSDGTPYTGDNSSKYSDIQGHRAQKYIDVLSACKILDEGEYFRPDDNITQFDYLKWIYRAVKQDTVNSADGLYNSLIYGYNVLGGDKRDENAEISYEDAIKYLIRLLGFTDVAELKDTYRTGFVDEGSINPDLIGYAAIAKGLNIINGNAFTPKNKVTRATAAEIIYNLLQS